jgi:dihydropyrimidinase
MKVDYNLYEGYKISGAPEKVISNGEIIIDSDRFIGQKGKGRYLKRELFAGNLV